MSNLATTNPTARRSFRVAIVNYSRDKTLTRDARYFGVILRSFHLFLRFPIRPRAYFARRFARVTRNTRKIPRLILRDALVACISQRGSHPSLFTHRHVFTYMLMCLHVTETRARDVGRISSTEDNASMRKISVVEIYFEGNVPNVL